MSGWRLPRALPQLGDRPVATERVLYKCGTGSYKSTEYLLSALGFLVIGAFGPETWEDDAVDAWTRRLVALWPPPPTAASLDALLAGAHRDGLVPRAVTLAEAPPDATDLSLPFRVGMLDRHLHGPPFDEATLLADALRRLAARWADPTLIPDAVQWAWPASLDLDRVQVTVSVLVVLRLMAEVDWSAGRTHLLRWDEDDPWDPEEIEQSLATLGV
ncbi:MAG: hypothetical protein H6739_08580 [Alphaproteobacteria bacterium]|nr:hypothetical protein [Alphaproteobacteria bacterium]